MQEIIGLHYLHIYKIIQFCRMEDTEETVAELQAELQRKKSVRLLCYTCDISKYVVH